MTHSPNKFRNLLKRAASCGLLAALAATSLVATAAQTQIATEPLANKTSVDVKPNILFMLDTSGSMVQSHVPDQAGGVVPVPVPSTLSNTIGNLNTVGYRSNSCNPLYYNPNSVYAPPKNADGTDFPNASFTGALYDGFQPAGPLNPTVDLSASFVAWDNNTSQIPYTDPVGPKPAYYYVFSIAGAAFSYNTAPCNKALSPATLNPVPPALPTSTAGASYSSAGGTWTKKVVGIASGPGGTDERQNFANWYSYYRTRMLMMKSAGSRAFAALADDKFRVGFVTTEPYLAEAGHSEPQRPR